MNKKIIGILLILKEYRRKGIGKALIYHAIDSFSDVTICEVYTLKFANEETLAFYQAIGFVNQGIPTIDETTMFGIHYKEMFYHFTYDLPLRHTMSQSTTRSIPTHRCSSSKRGIR